MKSSSQGGGWNHNTNQEIYNNFSDATKQEIAEQVATATAQQEQGDSANTTVIQNIYSSKELIKNPDVRGCKNASAVDKPFPLAIGSSYFVPNFIGSPYTIPRGDYGEQLEYHALYLLGYNDINVTDISLGLKLIASNVNRRRTGLFTTEEIDGEYDQRKYNIQIEIQNSDEVSLYNQKVIQQDINTELLYPDGEVSALEVVRFSSPYPQKCQIEIGLEGLVGKNADGEEVTGTVGVKVEYSVDGGTTWSKFGQVGDGSYDSTTGVTTFSMLDYHSMRKVAEKTFEWNEVKNAVNHVVEFRVTRTTRHRDDDYIHDTVTFNAIRTWCYDPDKSVNSFVIQTPMCEKDRERTTRLAISITSDAYLYDFGEFNCIVHALARTCTENNGYYTWSAQNVLSETSNPASMALMCLQSPMLGNYAYLDSDIDLQSLGAFYKFCNDYDIKNASGQQVGFQANGVITKQYKLSDLIAMILNVGRAYRVYHDNKIAVFIDKPIPYTTLILNNQNVLEASNSKSFDELPSGLSIGFTNEDNYYQSDRVNVDYPDLPYSRTSLNYTTIRKDYPLQTNVEQIQKNGLYELACIKLRPENWNRKVTSEGCLAFLGAKIEIQDDTIAVGIGDGAEIIALEYDDEESPSYITAIVTDGQFDVVDISKTYAIRVQQADATNDIAFVTKKVVTRGAGVYSRFELQDYIDLSDNIVPCIGDIVSFGEHGKITYETICMGKTDNGDGTYDLAVVPYDERIYTADQGTIPEFNSKVTVPVAYRKSINQKSASLQDVQNVLTRVNEGPVETPDTITSITANATENAVVITWAVPNSSGLKNNIKSYIVEISKDGGVTYPIRVKVGTNEYSYVFNRGTGGDGYPEASYFSNWRVKVTAENVYGKTSTPSTAVEVITSSYGSWTPATPTFASKIAEASGIILEWNEATGVNNRKLYGKITYTVKVYYEDSLRATLTTDNRSIAYNFNRAVDHYPEKPNVPDATITLDKYKVEITATNTDSGNYATGLQETIDYSSYKTWIPSIPTSAVAVWEKDCVTLTWNCDETATYGNNLYSIRVSSRSVYRIDLKLTTDKVFVYYFDRGKGQYPEVGEYELTLYVENESSNYVTVNNSDITHDWSKYLTWFPKTPVIQFSNTSGRTVSFEIRQDDTYWGWERYEVQISKDNQTWYGADTDSDPKLSEDNWKTTLNAVKQIYTNQFNQSLPLEGQSTSTGAVATNYYYRARAVTKIKTWDITIDTYVDTYRESSWSNSVLLVARPTQAVDIVNNAITTAKLNNNSVSTEKIINEAITADKIQANTITAEKLNAVAVNKINSLTGSDTTVGDTTAQGWILPSSGVEIATDSVTNVKCLKTTLNNINGIVTDFFEVKPDEILKFSFTVDNTANTSWVIYIGVSPVGYYNTEHPELRTFKRSLYNFTTGKWGEWADNGNIYFCNAYARKRFSLTTYICGCNIKVQDIPAPIRSDSSIANVFCVRCFTVEEGTGTSNENWNKARIRFGLASGSGTINPAYLIAPMVTSVTHRGTVVAEDIKTESLSAITANLGDVATGSIASAVNANSEPDPNNSLVYIDGKAGEEEFYIGNVAKQNASTTNTNHEFMWLHKVNNVFEFVLKITNFIVTSTQSVIKGILRVKNSIADADADAFMTVNPTDSASSGTGAKTLAVKGNVRADVLYSGGCQQKTQYNVDLRQGSSSNFYPVTFLSKKSEIDCEIYSPSFSSTADYNQNYIHFLLFSRGWNDTPKRFQILQYGVYDANEICIGCLGWGLREGTNCIWLRGGLSYTFYSNNQPTPHLEDYTSSSETFTVGENLYGGTNTYVDIAWTPNPATLNRPYLNAELNGNSSTATKLKTSRTLNIQDADASHTGTGVSFDGSADKTIKLPATIKADLIGKVDINAQNVIAFKDKSFNNFKIHDTQTNALYIEGREESSGDSGGIAITNDGVTVFGAGDTDGILRVIDEDNVSAGAVFKVGKDGAVHGASFDGTVPWGNITNKPFNWSGQSGQPSWLWGSNDGTNYYVWNPSNFSVNYAGSAGTTDDVSGYGINSLNPVENYRTPTLGSGAIGYTGIIRYRNGLKIQCAIHFIGNVSAGGDGRVAFAFVESMVVDSIVVSMSSSADSGLELATTGYTAGSSSQGFNVVYYNRNSSTACTGVVLHCIAIGH